MKLFLLLLTFSQLLFGVVQVNPATFKLFPGVQADPAFPSAPQAGWFPSTAQAGVATSIVAVQVINNSPNQIALECSGTNWPANGDGHEILIPPYYNANTPPTMPMLNVPLGKNCFLRSPSGITGTGEIDLTLWGF